MGIRNLAYCMMEHRDDGTYIVLAWDNVDLLEGGVSSQTAKQCAGCTTSAKWISESDSKKWCNKCANGKTKNPTIKPAFPTIPCSLAAKPLRELAFAEGMINAKKSKKDALILWAATRYLMPWKPAKTMEASMTTILRAMDTWLNPMLSSFSTANVVRLENQPVMKGPTMKSVQMILFTLLSHRLAREYAWNGRIDFVHAGTKTKNKELVTATTTPSDAYRARKRTAENDVANIIKDDTTWLTFFNGRTKKSDLADAFLMARRNI